MSLSTNNPLSKTQPIPTMPNPKLINSNSPIVSPFLKDFIVHIPYTNVKTFADAVLPSHVGDKELRYVDGVGTGKMTKKEMDDNGATKEPNKEHKLNEKAVPHKENDYHYLWHPTEMPQLNLLMKIHQDQRDPRLNLGIKRGKGGEFDRNDDVNGGHEEGEMMEHVDEVNFGLDGLRRGQSVRVQRSSLLSLLNVCGTLQQRRLLRTHG
ncbi:reverse transcriptase domain-containing protein [Tanacetum coccineum]